MARLRKRKWQTLSFLYCDAPGKHKWHRVICRPEMTRAELMATTIDLTAPTVTNWAAHGHLTRHLPRERMRPKTALRLIEAFGIADGVREPADDLAGIFLASQIVELPEGQRALLYYDCCACLGYDPADGP